MNEPRSPALPYRAPDADHAAGLEARVRELERRLAAVQAERSALEAHVEHQRARLVILAQAAETFSSSLDSRHALTALAKLVVPTLADWCTVDELAPDGTVRRLAVQHRDPAKVALARELAERYPPDPDAPRGVAAVLRSGKTEWMPEISDALLVTAARDQQHLALTRSLQLTSYAVVPLVTRGRVLGALSLVCEGRRRLNAEDVKLAEEISRQAALALDNARLYQAAEAARAQLEGLFHEAPAAIAIVRGPEHRFELANGPYEKLAGSGSLVGRTVREVFGGQDGARFAAALDQVISTGQPFVAPEFPIGAEPLFFSIVHQGVRGPGGAIDGVATFAFEVTAQVRSRQRIEALAQEVTRNEGRLRALVDATAAIVWTTKPSGDVVETSPSWLAFTGQSEAEYLNGGFVNAIHPDDRAATMAVWAAAVSAQAPYAAQYRLRRADGTYAHTLARAMPVMNADGTVREYAGCNVDITDQRRAEEEAHAHTEVLAKVNELGRVISAELDLSKAVQAVTDAATSLTGAQFGAFFYNVLDEQGGSYMLYSISGVPREAFSGFPMPRNTEVFAPTFAGRGVVRSDDITRDPRYGRNAPHKGMPPGHLPVRSYLAVPVISRSGEVMGGIFLGHAGLGVFDDRAEGLAVGLAAQAAVAVDNARLYGEAQRLIRALERSNRELDQFAYVTSHDLKAPLRGIGSLAEWLEQDLGPALDSDAKKKLDLLRGRVRRMEAMIQGILDFSRAGRSESEREVVDVRKLLTEVVELLGPRPPATVIIAEGMPVLQTERVALQQVLQNLIGNALKHARRPDVTVQVRGREAGDFWELQVADDGAGIAPEFHDRVWGIFQTLESRDKVENTGIGLAIVKKLVEGRGGRAWLESAPGAGATFFFTWPKREDRR